MTIVVASPLAALAQAVQLPTFNSFSASTTVLVPDRGSVSLGGVSSASSGRTQRGVPGLAGLGRPFNNVGIGNSTTAANARISAHIHDFEALDQATLAAGAAQVAADGKPGSKPLASSVAADHPPSLDEIHARQQRLATARQAEAAESYQQGLDALAAGKTTFAKIHFTAAARDASGELRQQAQSQLRDISAARTRLATSAPNTAR